MGFSHPLAGGYVGCMLGFEVVFVGLPVGVHLGEVICLDLLVCSCQFRMLFCRVAEGSVHSSMTGVIAIAVTWNTQHSMTVSILHNESMHLRVRLDSKPFVFTGVKNG